MVRDISPWRSAAELPDNDPEPEPARKRCPCGAFTSWIPEARPYLAYVMEDGTLIWETDYYWLCKRCGREEG